MFETAVAKPTLIAIANQRFMKSARFAATFLSRSLLRTSWAVGRLRFLTATSDTGLKRRLSMSRRSRRDAAAANA
jgi:hypothetical protein